MRELLQTGTLLVLVILFVIRSPSALRKPSARLSWIASGVGAAAMLTLGTVVPQHVIDAALGGSNTINLAQNLLASTAFWFVTQAALRRGGSSRRLPWFELISILVLITIPFAAIDRDSRTSYYFIAEHIEQLATWMYATTYMTAVAYMSTRLLIGLRGSPGGSYALFRIGAAVVILACADEILSLTLDHIDAPFPQLRQIAFALFDLLFYTGVIIIVSGIAAVTVNRWWREFRLWSSERRLGRIATRAGLSWDRQSDDSGLRLYNLVIQVRDLAISGSLSANALRELERAEVLVSHTLASHLLLDESQEYLVFHERPE